MRQKKKKPEVLLSRDDARAINAALRDAGFDGRGRWRTVGNAHADAGRVLEKFGYQFSDVLTGWDVRGTQGRLSLGISESDPEDPFYAMPVDNAAVFFLFTDLHSGMRGERSSYEVIAYL